MTQKNFIDLAPTKLSQQNAALAKKIKLTLATLLLTCAHAVFAEVAEDKPQLLFPDNPDSPCNQLHKVTSREDLLKQLYETAFKDDCAFALSNEQLADIWQIPVYLPESKAPEIRTNAMLYFEDIESPIGWHVYNFWGDFISIRPTRKTMQTEKTMFPSDRFPAFLGKPLVKPLRQVALEHFPLFRHGYEDDDSGDIEAKSDYCWDNEQRNFETATGWEATISKITFYKNFSMTSPCGE